MARQLRIQYPGAFYHVTSRGNEQKEIFRDKEDYELFLEQLSKSLAVHNVSLLGYVCMINHFHLLLTTPDGNLANFMRHFNIGYTGVFNRKYKRSGHLYQGRYKSFLVQEDAHLQELSRYIHLNPVRIKAHSRKDTKEKKAVLGNFRHSSFRGYIHPGKRDDFMNYSTVLNYFGGDHPEGRRAYQAFVEKGLLNPGTPLGIGRGSGIIGSEEFIEKIRDAYLAKRTAQNQREQPHLKEIQKKYQPEALIKKFCDFLNLDRKHICTRGRNSVERSILMELLYRYCKITQPEIGRLVGGIDYSAVSYARKRLREKMKKDNKIRLLFESVEVELSRIKI